MAKPSFINLWNAYTKVMKDYPNRSPCDGPWPNQCAIRMSVALNAEHKVKIDAHTYSEPKCSHGHARGAESLANWLWKKIGRPTIYTDGAEAKRKLSTSTGIIFYKDCFLRPGENRFDGDHIDVWNKGLAGSWDDPTNKAAQVWFWSLT